MQIIQEFQGDIYLERNEAKLLTKLTEKDLFGSRDTAQAFLHECSSYMLMKQNQPGFTGKQIGILPS
jgi:hypothetical protein